EKLRDVSDRYSAGQMDAATARLEIKNWLKVGDNVKDESIREALMSTARLDLILNQNQMMAAAVGARELALDPEIYEALPYYRYVPSTAANPRDEHRQFYGIVLDKKDPFWQTHTPPLDFGCKCSLDELTANEAGDKVGKAEQSSVASRQSSEGSRPALAESGSWSVSTPDGAVIIDTPESGYVFDVNSALSTCDMSRIDDITIRKAVLSQMRDFSRENPDTVFRCIPGTALTDKAVADFNPKEFSQFMESQKTYYAENNKKFDSTARLKIGNLSSGKSCCTDFRRDF
ncbi:MAG: phage minor head protein, partial [Lentisphaerae bacterium]|nr:phage minor head protein [Lentisphaerota bacterium]